MRGNLESDSGNYVNGIYTTKNGYNNLGLGCPKGVRLYDSNSNCPIFFFPEDTERGEEWRMITRDVVPGIMPYYAVSNYGRVENIFTQQVLKPNTRTNGYQYYCFSADCGKLSTTGKNKQKKANIHRVVMMTFEPVEDMEYLTVNHKNAVKTDNYVNKIMPDGSVESNLEWATPKENIRHAEDNNLRGKNKLTYEDAITIRFLHETEGLSYSDIQNKYYPNISWTGIQSICNNKNHKESHK